MPTYLVTGAGSGIGRAVAEGARAQGHGVCLFDRRFAADEPAARAVHREALVVEGDVADAESCREAVARTVAEFGELTGLSHNAGIQRYGTAQDTDTQTWDEVIAVNLTGGFNVAKAALPEIRKARGSLVFMGSVQSLANQQNVAAYTASKHGLLGLARSIAMDFAAESVRSNLVAPGAMKAPILDRTVSLADEPEAVWGVLKGMHPLGRVATAQEVANVVLFLLSEEASSSLARSCALMEGSFRRTPARRARSRHEDRRHQVDRRCGSLGGVPEALNRSALGAWSERTWK